jgi:hypothetical protein
LKFPFIFIFSSFPHITKIMQKRLNLCHIRKKYQSLLQMFFQVKIIFIWNTIFHLSYVDSYVSVIQFILTHYGTFWPVQKKTQWKSCYFG